MFYKRINDESGRSAIAVYDAGSYDIKDTFECGQCFRYEKVCELDGYVEYITVVNDKIITVGQKQRGELLFYEISDEDFESTVIPYFDLNTDYEKIRVDIMAHTDSKWLLAACEAARGIVILRQDPWETLFSFIISQNNNIPRIRKIIKKLSSEYGVNICLQNKCQKCPLSLIDGSPCEEKCRECGICYTFPTASAVVSNPEKLKTANPGFRYKYLCDAAERVNSGKTNLKMIAAARSYEHTKKCLTEIIGVGEKVASCTALFGFGNLDAFPIDVWMKRAIDEYFDGKLAPASLGRYAGVAQQYIFHYIRNLSK